MNKELMLLGLAKRAGKLAVGDEAASDALRSGSARAIVLASDAAENTRARFERLSGQSRAVRLELPYTKEELGGILGRASCAAAAVCDVGFAASLASLFSAAHPVDEESLALAEKLSAEAEAKKLAARAKKKADAQARRQHTRQPSAAAREPAPARTPAAARQPDSAQERRVGGWGKQKVYGKPPVQRGGPSRAAEHAGDRRPPSERNGKPGFSGDRRPPSERNGKPGFSGDRRPPSGRGGRPGFSGGRQAGGGKTDKSGRRPYSGGGALK